MAEQGDREQPAVSGERDLVLWVEQGFPRMGLGWGVDGMGSKIKL